MVRLSLGPWHGYGEAPAIPYYQVTVEKMMAELTEKKELVEKFAFTDPERYWHYLHHLLPGQHFLVCALDMAGWDLFGQMKSSPLYRLWDTSWENTPVTDYTIGIDTPEKMLEKMQAHPWPVYKIKLGTAEDIRIMEMLRKHSDAAFRVDANAGWTLDEARQLIPVLASLGVEFVEQPLAKDDWDGMRVLYHESVLPLFADESCVSEKDVAACAGHFHGINIKLTKCSGITPARRMIQEARQLGLKVMMGSMNESSVGSAAIANFLPQLDYVDMDGPLLLAQDVAKGIQFNNGEVRLSGHPGLGIHYSPGHP
jgi:L-alanine-DL-glutamate epimerase-like enolase superfamily enzyme